VQIESHWGPTTIIAAADDVEREITTVARPVRTGYGVRSRVESFHARAAQAVCTSWVIDGRRAVAAVTGQPWRGAAPHTGAATETPNGRC
jgi:hypothetical protein